MSNKNYVPVRRTVPATKPVPSTVVTRRKIQQNHLVDYVGKVAAPSVQDIVTELRLAVGETLIELRGFSGSLKEKSLIIKNFVQSIHILVQIEKIDSIDMSNMTEIELIEVGKKLLNQ